LGRVRCRIQNNNSYIIEKLEPTVLEEVKLHGEEQERSVIFAYLSLMLTHLSLGDHTRVQFYLRRLFKSKSMGQAFNFFYETIDMISHYESGDHDILQNLLTSKKRKIRREPNFGTPFYREILHFFSQLLDGTDPEVCVSQLKSNADKNTDDGLLRLMNYFLLEDWMNAMLENKTYGEYVSTASKG
jgi:hypothetical protein